MQQSWKSECVQWSRGLHRLVMRITEKPVCRRRPANLIFCSFAVTFVIRNAMIWAVMYNQRSTLYPCSHTWVIGYGHSRVSMCVGDGQVLMWHHDTLRPPWWLRPSSMLAIPHHNIILSSKHWDRDIMATVLQTIFWNAFSCMRMYGFR